MLTIISGTNRAESNTLKVARYYQRTLAEKGVKSEILSLENLPADLLATDLYGKRSEQFLSIQNMVSNTTKFIFIIPEYNGSFPGALKLFIDACDFPSSFYDKKAALVGISSGKYGNIRGIDHFGGVCSYLHLNVLPLRLHIPVIKTEFDEGGNFYKEDTVKFTTQQIDKFILF
ncbi:MAG: NADPH-dependent FMN reductase [Bacteroidota bacterium]